MKAPAAFMPMRIVLAFVAIFVVCNLLNAPPKNNFESQRSLGAKLQDTTEEGNRSHYLRILELSHRNTPHTPCAFYHQKRLRHDHGLQLEIKIPESHLTSSLWDAKRGSHITIPVHNTLVNLTNSRDNSRHYTLWARLVTDRLIIPTARILYHYDSPGNSSLFAELQFTIWEEGAYGLEVELRYAYGKSGEDKSNTTIYQTHINDADEVFSRYLPHHAVTESSHTNFFNQNHHAEVPVTHLSNTRLKVSVNEQCLAITGSPYQLRIQKESMSPSVLDRSEGYSPPTRRLCTAADTLLSGYWEVLNGTRQERPVLQAERLYKFLWDPQHEGPQFHWRTPGCDWEFPDSARLERCLLGRYNGRINLAGDSLMRYLFVALDDYIKRMELDGVTFGRAFKKAHVDDGVRNISAFSVEGGGVFIDDFNLIHHIGFGGEGDAFGDESSPGRLAHELRQNQEYMARQLHRNNTRFFYYVSHYMNGFPVRQGFEPYVTHYAAVAAEFLSRESGYEVFDTNRLLRPLVEATRDGLHYHADITSMIAIMMFNAMCDRDSS